MRFWQDKTLYGVEAALKTSSSHGLSKKQAKKRLADFGPNDIFPVVRGDLVFYFKRVASNLLCLLLLVSALIAYIFGRHTTALIMALIATLSLFITTVIYIKARRVLEDMESHKRESAVVIREGRAFKISARGVVPGDLIRLSQGDIVPCDARIVYEKDLLVREEGVAASGVVSKDALFVGERKTPPSECKNMLFAGTIIENGTAYALCCETGVNTLIARTKHRRKRSSFEAVRIMAVLRRLSSTVTLFMICLVFALTAYLLLPIYRGSILDGYLLALSYAAGTMCELYTFFGTVIIAVGIHGAFAKKQNKALIKNPAAIDRISDTSVIIAPPDALYDESGIKLSAIYINGEESPLSRDNASSVEFMTLAALSTAAYGVTRLALAGEERALSAEESEILKACGSCGVYGKELDLTYKLLDKKSHQGSLDISLIENEREKRIVVRGSTDIILRICSRYRFDGKILKMDDKARESLSALADALISGASRVKALASLTIDKNASAEDALLNINDLSNLAGVIKRLVFEGFMTFTLPIAAGTAMAIRRSDDANIKTVLFASDAKEACAIFRAVGLNEPRVLTSDALSEMSDDILRTDVRLYDVFSSLSGREKQRVIKAFRANGETVMFIARELRDLLLMRASDSSVAIADIDDKKTSDEDSPPSEGTRHTDFCDAIRYVADVLSPPPSALGGGYVSATEACERTKSIHASVIRMIKYLLLSGVSRLFVLLYTIFSGSVLVTPIQALTLGLVFDLVSVMAISFSRPASAEVRINKEEIKAPITQNYKLLLIGAILGVESIVGYIVIEGLQNATMARTASFLILLLALPIVLFEVIRDDHFFKGNIVLSRALAAVIALPIVFLSALYLTGASSLFSIAVPSLMVMLVVLVALLIIFLIFEIFRFFE